MEAARSSESSAPPMDVPRGSDVNRLQIVTKLDTLAAGAFRAMHNVDLPANPAR